VPGPSRTSVEHRQKYRGSERHSGRAVFEFAVCLPILALVVFASLEACSTLLLRQSLQTSAYEAARAAVASSGTTEGTISRGLKVLQQRGVEQGSVAVSPNQVESLKAGDRVTVTVTAPVSANRIIPQWFFGAGNMSADCVMLKEGRRP